MPRASKRPAPPARMVQLLAAEKRRLLADHGDVARQDFDEAWERCWEVMVDERAFPHATRERRGWRIAMQMTRSEMQAAFLDEPTPYARVAERITSAASAMCVRLDPGEVPRAVLAAHAYVKTSEGEELLAA